MRISATLAALTAYIAVNADRAEIRPGVQR
jgi:hypothetical protein